MKFDITNQQLFASLSTLLLVAVLGTVATAGGDFSPLEVVNSPSLFGEMIKGFELNHRGWSITISSVITLWVSISLGRVMTAYNILDRACFIQLPIAGVVAWGVAQSSDFLLSSLMLYLSVGFLRSIFRGVRNDNRGSLEHLFNSALTLSLLPMLYSPAIILWAVIPIALLVMGVTLREWIVMLVGLMVAPLIVIYSNWLCGGELWQPVEQFVNLLQEETNMLDQSALPLFDTITVALLLLCSVLGTVIVSLGESAHRIKVRQRIVVVLLMASVATIFSPSANVNSLTLLTPPLVVLSSIALVKIRGLFATVIYTLLLLLFLLSEFFPIYLPIQ